MNHAKAESYRIAAYANGDRNENNYTAFISHTIQENSIVSDDTVPIKYLFYRFLTVTRPAISTNYPEIPFLRSDLP